MGGKENNEGGLDNVKNKTEEEKENEKKRNMKDIPRK